MLVKIISNNKFGGTKVIGANGEELPGVRGIDIHMHVNNINMARIEVIAEEVIVDAEATLTTTYQGQKYKLVEMP